MAWFSKLFGGKSAEAEADASAQSSEEYKGFRISAQPIREGGQYRISAKVEKDGQVHQLIRADTVTSIDDATAISLAKARQVIDEQGEKLFG
jgi:hypothetical protein